MNKIVEFFNNLTERSSKILSIIGLIIIFVLFTLMATSCKNEDDSDLIPLIEDVVDSNYLCEQFEIDLDQYSGNQDHIFRIKPILFGSVILNSKLFIKNINKAFKDTNISFELMPTERVISIPEGKLSCYDLLDGYYQNGYITALIVPEELSFIEERSIKFQGKANGIPSITNPATGKPSFFVRQSVVYTAVTIHEIGHIFGLNHTFKGEQVSDRGFNCYSGDKVPDTVKTPEGFGVGQKSCEFYAPEDWELTYTIEELEQAVVNFMSYSPPHCMALFTEGQIQLINKMISINSRLQDAKI